MGRVRKTIQQALVLEAVNALHNHPTMEQVYEQVLSKHPNIGRATVYRNLLQLAEAGEISSVNLHVPPIRYDNRISPHFHFRCRQCGAILDVEAEDDLDELFNSRFKAPEGALVESRHITFEGLCPDCI